jgi:hypothetical protein
MLLLPLIAPTAAAAAAARPCPAAAANSPHVGMPTALSWACAVPQSNLAALCDGAVGGGAPTVAV